MIKPIHYTQEKCALVSVILALLCLVSHSQTVAYSIDLTLDGAPNTASYQKGDRFLATIKIDKSSLKSSGEERLEIGEGFISIRFSFIEGHIYTEANDPSNGYPSAYFTDGKFTGFDFWNSDGIVGGGERSFFRFYRDGSFQYSPKGADEFEGSYTHSVDSVPEPSSSLLSLLGFIYLAFFRRRISS